MATSGWPGMAGSLTDTWDVPKLPTSFEGMVAEPPLPWGGGRQGRPHHRDQAHCFFGDHLEGWDYCRAIVTYDLGDLRGEEHWEVKYPASDWLCRKEREPGSDYCEIHPNGDSTRKEDRKAEQKLEARRRRQAAAAAAREAKLNGNTGADEDVSS